MEKQSCMSKTKRTKKDCTKFSEMEVDAAWQLIQLSADSEGRTPTSSSGSTTNYMAAGWISGKDTKAADDESSVMVDDIIDIIDEEDCHAFRRKKKKYRGIDDIYKSTKPLDDEKKAVGFKI